MTPVVFLPIASALLWAVSSPVINIGLRRIANKASISVVLVVLLVAQFAGILVLSSIVVVRTDLSVSPNAWLVLSGIFTYPLATGFYYASALSFGSMSEVSSQFAKVKPILSTGFGLLLFEESVSGATLISAAMIAIGISLFVWAALNRRLEWRGVIYGLCTALFWSIGEVLMTLGAVRGGGIGANLVALCSGGLCTFSFLACRGALGYRPPRLALGQTWPFLFHGVVSFALAYCLFFESLAAIGLTRTVIVNAFWPMLALIFASLFARAGGRSRTAPPVIWLAGLIICLGSLAEIIELSALW